MKNKKAAASVIEYLEMVRKVRGKKPQGFAYNGVEDLILKEGEVFIPAPLPEEISRGRMKMCFKNATEAALRQDDISGVGSWLGDGLWEYTEGFALCEGLIPVQHAWLSRNGVAVDPTWTDGIEYVGIRFNKSLLASAIVATRTYGLLDDWRNGFPLLRNKFDSAQLEEYYKNLLDKCNA